MSSVRRYVAWLWLIEQTGKLDDLLRASVDNGGEREFTNKYAATFHLTERQISETLGGYFQPVDGLDKDMLQVVVEDKAGPPDDFLKLDQNTFAIGLDVPVSLNDFAAHRNAIPNVAYHDRRQAEALIGADEVRDYGCGGKRRVNVVIVDSGVDGDYLAQLGYSRPLVKKGVSLRPKLRKPGNAHGSAVARNVLMLAPGVRFYDLSLLPDRIVHVDGFAGQAIPLLIDLAVKIASDTSGASWVVVCPWGLADTKYDRPLGTYTRHRGHPLSFVFSILSMLGADIVFSAGNSGQFWPDLHSGGRDRGPFSSIYGSNGLPEVLTVGAVDPLGVWTGSSSQGPEPDGLRPPSLGRARKPDVCAPSGFRETGDRHTVLAGTSGACAVAAGIVASVRQRIGQAQLSPFELVKEIRNTARREGYGDADSRLRPAEWRLGSGIIDGRELVRSLRSRFPTA